MLNWQLSFEEKQNLEMASNNMTSSTHVGHIKQYIVLIKFSLDYSRLVH